MALPYLFEFWAHPHQLPPDGDWRSWVILGGRGAGKTRAGAEWVRPSRKRAPPDQGAGKARRLGCGNLGSGAGVLMPTHGRASTFHWGKSELYRLRVLRDGQNVVEFTMTTPQAVISNAQITTHDLDRQNKHISIEVAQISNAYGPGIAAVLEMG